MVAPNPHPLPDQLRSASHYEWNGQLVFTAAQQRRGLLVLSKGRVAWAICNTQRESLGTFLRRLGHVTPKDLQSVQAQYNRHKGKRKIGALLEEAGIIRRPVLRRCLLLHTRCAVEGLLAQPDLEIQPFPGSLAVDAEMTFSLEELMPQAAAQPSDNNARDWSRWSDKNRALAVFRDVTGYRGSALISADGEVVAAHTSTNAFDPTVLGVYLAAVLESSSRAVVPTQLGAVDFVLLDCDHGALVARWLDSDRRHLVVVLIDADGRLGGVKHRINTVLSDLKQAIPARD